MFEINEGVLGPETLTQLFAGDEFTWSFEQGFQNLDGLIGDLEASEAFVQFTGSDAEFERTEADTIG